MFTIQKDLNGIFWHIYNNARTRVNVSDFDVVIDDVSNTFIIQCKNGSNIPNQAISISLIQVIDLSVGTSPILFSGANGLIQLLTAKGYTPYLQVPPSVSVVVYRVGQVGVFTMTPTQFTDNFTETGLGTNTMLGWALRNGNNGTKNQQGKFSLNKGVSPYDVIGTLGGSANSVLIGHDHESAVFSNGRKGVNDTGTGGTFNGNVLVEAEANQKIVKTSIKGQSNTGADVPSEDGVGKNMPPYLIDVWVERVTELVINSGSGGGGGIQSIVAGTNITVDDSDPQNPIVSASGGGVESVTGTTVDNTDPLNPVVGVPTLQQVTDEGATTTNQITVQNVKIGSNAFSNTIVGDIPTLPTGTGTTAIGRAAGSAATGFGGTYIGAQAGSANAFNKNICLSANQNASTASSDNQLVINTNTKNIRFDTNVPLNILFQFPTVGGRFPISVNGNTADSAGNIVVPSGAVDSVNGQTGVVVLDAGDVGAEPTKGADDNYVTDAQLVVIGNTSGTNSGDNATNTTSNAYADAKVADTISDGVTTVAPSQNAVFDALDLKQNTSTLIFDSFQKAIMRDNYFWFVPNAISSGVSAAFANSERISGASFQYLNNGAITRGLLAFNTTVVPGILAFSRRNDTLILTGLEVVFTRKIQFNSNVSGQRFFSGISKGNQFVAPTNVEPDTLTDIVGVCQLSSSTNMHVVHNDASGTATTIDLGSSYPCTDSQYNYYITIEQTTTTYIVTVERVTVSTGASISTTNTLSTNIPVYNTGTIQLLTWISNNATAAIASYLDGGAIGNVKNQ